MHITKIELEDFKSHADSKFEFNSGKTAITGENGAGKTTLIEAVAWTLFDLLDYKKEDIVRRGAKKGTARVTFESGLDEREYTVYRDTLNGYNVYDPQLKTRIADKKEEVCRFMWQHLGVEPGTDLKTLFRQAIGVPQGTMTSDFLKTPEQRKPIFDKLLRVEEYRRGSDELLKTSRYIEQRIASAREKIARAEGELNRFDAIEVDHKNIVAQVEELVSNLQTINREVSERNENVRKFDEIAGCCEKLRTAFDKIASDAAKTEILHAQKERDRDAAVSAAKKIQEAEPLHLKHLAALGRLKELERERFERDKLNTELTKVESALINVKADQKRFQENLDNALKAHHTIELLKPLAEEQGRLETELEAVRNKAANARAIANQITSLTEKINRLRDSYKANQAQKAGAESKSKGAADLTELQKRDFEIVQKLAQLRASLDRDERFQSEIKNGLCPILSQKCLNLKEGETLESFVTSQFSELRAKITVYETQHRTVALNLQSSREADKYIEALEAYTKRAKEIEAEGKSLTNELLPLQNEYAGLPSFEGELAQIESQLAALENPKAKIAIFQKESAREFELRENITKIESNLERLDTERLITVEQLESYKDTDELWLKFSEERDNTLEAHRVHLANETAALLRELREKEFDESNRELLRLRELAGNAEKELADASGGYDQEMHITEKSHLLGAEKRKAELGATLNVVNQREAELAADLARLAETRKAMTAEFIQKERLEKIAEATTFIRDTLKEAAPRVARNYVHHVSLEANQMFREISGNAEHTLKWAEDYGIMLEEGGYDRPFISLSGGEQMAAALSVRLALLKQLSDIRIAFFDEPTTNMDAERRENLAMQISQITHFDQLFVISHDDTFENYVDNVVAIERD